MTVETGDAGDARAAGGIERMFAREPGAGDVVWFTSNLTVVKATAESTGGAYGLVESVIPPGASPPMHIHHREDEAFWVLEGEFTMVCGGRTVRAAPGAFIFLPRGVPHTFVVESDTPARMLTLLTPGGGEQFFVEMGRPAERAELPPTAPLDLDRLRRIAAKFGMEVVGPPLARTSQRIPGEQTDRRVGG